ncbi:MAG: hypothetical protein ACRD3B_04815 [Candidatus Sulfotelmatobacter sp.]
MPFPVSAERDFFRWLLKFTSEAKASPEGNKLTAALEALRHPKSSQPKPSPNQSSPIQIKLNPNQAQQIKPNKPSSTST